MSEGFQIRSVRVDVPAWNQARATAEREQMTMSELVRRLVDQFNQERAAE